METKASTLTLRHPLKIFFAVVRALFLRELNTRFSQGRLGLFWTFFQPFFQIALFVLLHALILQGEELSTYDYTVFMASGFIAFNLFRGILSSSIGAFDANKGIFVYKQVKPIDTVITRVLLETFMTGVIIIIFLLIGFFLRYDNMHPENFVMVTLSFFWLIVFSTGIGLLVAVGSTFFPSIGKTVSILSFILLFTSGVFYSLENVPPEAQTLLLYNPVLHFMEMIHGFYIPELTTRYVDYNYMLLWTVIPLFLALWLYVRLEKRIISA